MLYPVLTQSRLLSDLSGVWKDVYKRQFYDRVMGITHVNMVKQKEKISK